MGSTKSFSYRYPRPAVTADIAVVTLEAKPRVLLIQRKGEPFAGSWALPGGFVEENESLEAAALRELHEETGVENILLEQVGAFGDPGRDPRGWTVTVAFLGRVRFSEVRAVAADDAAAVEWFEITKLPPMAFDHDKILATVRDRIR